MKQIIVLIAMIALGVFLGGLINGTGAGSMKTSANTFNQSNTARYSTVSGW